MTGFSSKSALLTGLTIFLNAYIAHFNARIEEYKKVAADLIERGLVKLDAYNTTGSDNYCLQFDSLCGRPRGPTEKASEYESGDSRFESWRGRFLFLYRKAIRRRPVNLRIFYTNC